MNEILNTRLFALLGESSQEVTNLGLSSALGLLTPDANSKEEDQIPVKKKKKKPKYRIRR